MTLVRNLTAAVAVVTMAAGLGLPAAPASAQFFFQTVDLTGGPITGQEPAYALPDATPAENEAALLWSLRAALNVAALQCDLAQSLLTVDNYNAMLGDHRAELKKSFDTLDRYFVRIKKSKPAGQTALDQYGTRIYSSFSTVGGQLTFCQTAHSIGRDAIFTPRGQLLSVAQARMRELRNSLAPSGEQLFPGFAFRTNRFGWLPVTDPKCWKKDQWNGKCGPMFGSTTVAAR
ncbi:MAG: hypothetical protein V4659_00865 [Pseudomonadota bacterium]